MSATTASATLSPKNEVQGNHSSSRPVAKRPRTAPPPAMPTHTPMACGRSSSGKEVVMTDSVVGMIAAAPTPISIAHDDELVGVGDEEPERRRSRRRRAGR